MKGDFTRLSFDHAKHYHGVLKQQGRVDLDADWNEQGELTSHRIETEALDVIGPAGAPSNAPGFVLTATANGTGLTISKGRAYVDGILCENEQDLAITSQPDLPGFSLPTAAGLYIAYLEVWLRHLTSLDDRGILEDALGGPDTCTRARTTWQAKLLAAGKVGSNVGCSTAVPAWDQLIAPSTGTLQARAQPDPTSTDPCVIPASAGYRSLENQLYRVEIHDAGDLSGGGKVTWKWSRDNGSVVTSWTAQSGSGLTVTSAGRDGVLGFAAGQWVELTDDTSELSFQPGTLVQLSNVQGLTLTIDPATATGPTTLASFPRNPKVRRWDSAGAVAAGTASWLDLEDGVQVHFSGGTYANGDYWLIPARTLTANVDWPVDGSGNPVAEPPKGIRRHFCRLAVVQFDGRTWSVVAPCLPIFDPITTVVRAKGIHITDVQLARPAGPLLNDSTLPLSPMIETGLSIRVLCDAPIAPVSAQPSTCYVTVDLPYPLDVIFQTTPSAAPNAQLIGYQSLILPAQVGVTSTSTGNEIDLAVQPGIMRILFDILSAGQSSRLLTRLVLKGCFIWGRDDPTLYLDGAAFGVARQDPDETQHIGLRLPKSGNGTPGSDFEMWFWLSRPIQPTNVAFSPASVSAGQASTGTVTLSAFAPSGGAAVGLTANNTSLATLSPNPLMIPEGSTAATFSATNTTVPAGAASATLLVTATYAGNTAQGNLTINQVAKITNVGFSPTPILGGSGNATGTVTLSAPAPAGGALVTLAGNQPTTAPVPASVTIAANNSSATFTVTPASIAVNTTMVLTVTATYAGNTVQGTLTILGQRLT
jgi:hypothetical protein